MAAAGDDALPDLYRFRSMLSQCGKPSGGVSRLIRVASVITQACVYAGVQPPVVVGGLAVETYTSGGYTTRDVDMVTSDDVGTDRVMRALGFSRQPGHRYYEHPECSVLVEFPTGPLDGSRDRTVQIELDDGSSISVIGIEDIIVDRAAAYKFWDRCRENSEDATQAVLMLVAHYDRIDWEYLLRRAAEIGSMTPFRCCERDPKRSFLSGGLFPWRCWRSQADGAQSSLRSRGWRSVPIRKQGGETGRFPSELFDSSLRA